MKLDLYVAFELSVVLNLYFRKYFFFIYKFTITLIE